MDHDCFELTTESAGRGIYTTRCTMQDRAQVYMVRQWRAQVPRPQLCWEKTAIDQLGVTTAPRAPPSHVCTPSPTVQSPREFLRPWAARRTPTALRELFLSLSPHTHPPPPFPPSSLSLSLSPGLHTITSGPACTRPSTRRVARLPEPEPVSRRPRDSATHSVPNMWLHAPCMLRSADPIRPVFKLPVRWSRSIAMPPVGKAISFDQMLLGCKSRAPGLVCVCVLGIVLKTPQTGDSHTTCGMTGLAGHLQPANQHNG